jgi:hypothetical protein
MTSKSAKDGAILVIEVVIVLMLVAVYLKLESVLERCHGEYRSKIIVDGEEHWIETEREQDQKSDAEWARKHIAATLALKQELERK